ncbi:c-type cytochrome [Psychroserpens algicola]|uniref:c-type cytochrome n=1 Tax=Psychroserpens algicola TaxID=1719034 RepID=UPI0019540342|nr:c-type cytochrome [Psychroserpens algicola]
MINTKKIILRIAAISSIILILLVVFFIFIINKNGFTEFDEKSTKNQQIKVKEEKLSLGFLAGKEIFQTDCNMCHPGKSQLHYNLDNALEEMEIEYFKLYLTKQDSLILVKDNFAIAIKENYGNMGNSHNFKYSDEELNQIIEYLK